MKKLLIGILVLAMTLGTVACGNDEDTATKEANHGAIEETETSESEESTETVGEVTSDEFVQTLDCLASNNYRLPTDFNKANLDEDLVCEVFAYVLDGVQQLDAEVLKPFVDEDKYNDYYTFFELIKASELDTEFWNKTVGLIDYYPVSDIIVGKNIDYVQAAWYTDCDKNNVDLGIEDVAELSDEELTRIYKEYYVNAPMDVAYEASGVVWVNDDNYFRCNVDDIFEVLGYPEMYDILGIYTNNNINYSTLLLGEEDCLSLGYDYIDADILCVDSLLNRDLTEMIELTKAIDESEKDGPYWKCFETYFLDEKNLAVVQEFINNECIILRDLSMIQMFIPSDFSIFPLSVMKDGKEIDEFKAKNYNLMYQEQILEYIENDDIDSFSAFYDLIEIMKAKGYFAE